jgi:hypothetical protein
MAHNDAERDQQSSNTYCTSLEDLSDLPSGGGVEQSPSLVIVAAISSASVTSSQITIIAPHVQVSGHMASVRRRSSPHGIQ